MSDTPSVTHTGAPLHSEQEEVINALNAAAKQFIRTDPHQAVIKANEALDLARGLSHQLGIANAQATLATCFLNFDNYSGALECAMEAHELFENAQDLRGMAGVLNTLGGVYNQMGDLEKRLQCNLQCLHLRQEIGDVKAAAGSFNNIGDTYLSMGDYPSAQRYFEHCLQIEDLSDSTHTVVLHNMGEVQYLLGRLEAAEDYLLQALEMGQLIGYKSVQIASQHVLAQLNLDLGRLERVSQLLTDGLKMAEEVGSPFDQYRMHQLWAHYYEKQGETENAYQSFKRFHHLKDQVFNDDNVRKVKNLQFQHELNVVRKDTEREREKNAQLKKAFARIETQNIEIKEQHRNITDSIIYAQKIQQAILPDPATLKDLLNDYFVLYMPKDIVSGDFYWVKQVGHQLVFAVMDCTGHGVPGAMLTTFAYNGLNRVVAEFGVGEPAEMLQHLQVALAAEMQHSIEHDLDTIPDGMDLSLCVLDVNTNELKYCGANNDLFLLTNNSSMSIDETLIKKQTGAEGQRLYQLHATKRSLDFFSTKREEDFQQLTLKLQVGDRIYLTSDGFADQFGGPKSKKYLVRRFRELLMETLKDSMKQQGEAIREAFAQWQKAETQVDDVCVFGIRIGQA